MTPPEAVPVDGEAAVRIRDPGTADDAGRATKFIRRGRRYSEGPVPPPSEEEHRSLDVLVPAVEARPRRQRFELGGVGGMEEEPAAAEPRTRHHPQRAGVGDDHVAPDLSAWFEDPVELAQRGALIGQHV